VTPEAIGHRMTYFSEQNSYYNIVGVADDIRAVGLQEAPIQEAYFPMVGPSGKADWFPFRSMRFVVRAPSMSSTALVARVRQVVTQMDPQVPIATCSRWKSSSQTRWRRHRSRCCSC
jgi:hypothetical protein